MMQSSMNILIEFLCLFIAACVAAGAALFAYKVGYIKRDAEQVKTDYKTLSDEYDRMLGHIQQLEFQIDTEQKEKNRNQSKSTNGWDPANPLSSAERDYGRM